MILSAPSQVESQRVGLGFDRLKEIEIGTLIDPFAGALEENLKWDQYYIRDWGPAKGQFAARISLNSESELLDFGWIRKKGTCGVVLDLEDWR